MVEGKFLMKILQTKGMAYMLHELDTEEEEKNERYLGALLDILDLFKGVFELPQGLPPERG